MELIIINEISLNAISARVCVFVCRMLRVLRSQDQSSARTFRSVTNDGDAAKRNLLQYMKMIAGDLFEMNCINSSS